MHSRREFLRLSTIIAGTVVVLRARPTFGTSIPRVTVYKSPTCGCCAKWVEHLRHNGFTVAVTDMEGVTPIKQSLGVPASLYSCHTAVTGAYVIEGHVPADLLQRLLRERPTIAGLAVPGMPNDAPGMDGAGHGYSVVAFDRNGGTRLYARRPPSAPRDHA